LKIGLHAIDPRVLLAPRTGQHALMYVQQKSTAGQKREARKQREQQHGKVRGSGLDLVHELLNSIALKDCSEKVRSLIKVRQIDHRLGSLQHVIYCENALFCGSVVDRLLQVREQRPECVRTLTVCQGGRWAPKCQMCGCVFGTLGG